MKRIINQNDVERVSAEVIISYLRRIGMNDMVPYCIDIDDFVAKYLKCSVVIEDIYQSSDCLGYLSYGIKPWDNLIMTFSNEKGGYDGKLIDAMIKCWLL